MTLTLNERALLAHEMGHIEALIRSRHVDEVTLMDGGGDHLDIVCLRPIPQETQGWAAITAAFAGAFFRHFASGGTLAALNYKMCAANGVLAMTGVLNDPAVSDFDRELIDALPDPDACAAEIDLAMALASRLAGSPEMLDGVAHLLEQNGQVTFGRSKKAAPQPVPAATCH